MTEKTKASPMGSGQLQCQFVDRLMARSGAIRVAPTSAAAGAVLPSGDGDDSRRGSDCWDDWP